MKLNITRYFVLIITAVVFIGSCKKGAVKPAAINNSAAIQAQQQKQAIQVAVNLYKSITGQYGGANISSGLKLTSAAYPAKGLKVADVPPFAVCGTTVTTTPYNAYTANDTAYVNSGTYLFTYLCDSVAVNGYKNNNQFYVKATDAKAQTSDSLHVTQQYTVTTVGGNDKYYFLVNGQLTTAEHNVDANVAPYKYFNQPETADYADNNTVYTIQNVYVPLPFYETSSNTISSGTVTYTATYLLTDSLDFAPDAYNSTGTITFLGNNLVTIDAFYPAENAHYVHTINIVTGQVVN